MVTTPDEVARKAGSKRKHESHEERSAKKARRSKEHQSSQSHTTDVERAYAKKRGRKQARRRTKHSTSIPSKADETDHEEQAEKQQASQEHGEAQPTSQRAAEKKARRIAERREKDGVIPDAPSTHVARTPHSTRSELAEERRPFPNWTLSAPSAGRFLDHDPTFVQDENGDEYLLAANEREVQLLSLESSLVVRTHPAPVGHLVVCLAVDEQQDNVVRVAYSDETISLWDWTIDEEVEGPLTANGAVRAMAHARTQRGERSALCYIVHSGGQDAIYGQQGLLHSTKQQLQDILVLGDAEYILARSQAALTIGVRKDGDRSKAHYTWFELPLAVASTCLDARLLLAPLSGKKGAKGRPGLRIAIGNEKGAIHLFDNVSSLFPQEGQRSLPPPRILHWHRDAVSSVKFSQDGNYLISGGNETVLVLWQLETGKKQYLPHLTSAIERVVVNSEGNRYAVQMGDNSIVVLNTSELKPVANFAGLQMLSPVEQSKEMVCHTPAATLHPQDPSQLLLGVPASQPKLASDIGVRPFLQTFDIRNSRHITRQALTRNNVTDLNLGPGGIPVLPPDVDLLAISVDGTWLATVDEWMPPASDVEHLASTGADVELQRQNRREVYLKFWTWDNDQALWTLTTRMDSPHARSNGDIMGPGKVLALVSDPSTKGFATIGEDSCIKLWRARKRTSQSAAPKGKSDGPVVEWECKREVQLVSDNERADSPMYAVKPSSSTSGSLAYSADGSMLAVAQASSGTDDIPVVHFLNTFNGDVVSKPGLAATEVTGLGCLDRYLIVVSHPAVYVWDIVTDTLKRKLKLRSPKELVGTGTTLLAINQGDSTFALVTSQLGNSKVKVYDTHQFKSQYEQSFDTPVECILADKGARGYTMLFADATIRTLLSSATPQARLESKAKTELPIAARQSLHANDAADGGRVELD
ncbi:NET1-associated nuclear protein 1, partial [Vermiconidia calcicola]